MKVATYLWIAALILIFSAVMISSCSSEDQTFHGAPPSARGLKHPYAGQKAAAEAGRQLYSRNCGACHGNQGQGTANIPSIRSGPAQSASAGEVFWFITHGDVANGMPAWDQLPEEQRWQIVTFLKTLPSVPVNSANPAAQAPTRTITGSAPSPPPPFTDYRFEKPGTMRHITVQDLPPPYATKSAGNGPDIVARPANAWPQAPAGFKVEQYAAGLNNPRLIITAPNGDFFVAEGDAGEIEVFRGITGDGRAQQMETFASGLKRPYGIAFYPPGPDPQWIYIGSTASIVRFPYVNGDVRARGAAQHIADLPDTGGGHWTRDLVFSPDGKKMFVGVGSATNVDDPDNHPDEKNRADILEFNPDGSGMEIFAYGIRNAGGGLAFDPKTRELWCSVNERDGLGDNLVPDYITHVQEGGFYGWPWWYMGGHQDPRQMGKHPELQSKIIVPDVLLQPHNASLEMTFYEGKQFPAEYRGDIFVSEHGSWNKTIRAGYEVIRVPLHQSGHASGEYEDFLTGFVVENGHVWGRPVGVAVAQDGSLLVTDDGSNSIWRVSYTGTRAAHAGTN